MKRPKAIVMVGVIWILAAGCLPARMYAGVHLEKIRLPAGFKISLYARGIRNTVGFDWHPQTQVLWFTNNGRDWSGCSGHA